MMVQRTTKRKILGMLAVLSFFSLVRDHWAEPEERLLQRSFLTGYIQRTHPQIHSVDRDRLVLAILDQAGGLALSDQKIDGAPVDRVLFLTAVIETESTFKSDAISSMDARGYMQLLPSTAKWMGDKFGLGVPATQDLFRPEVNLPRGVIFLNHLNEQLRDIRLVCLAYNAGLGNVQRGYWDERYWQKIYINYRRLSSEAEDNRWMSREVSGVRDI